LSKLYSSFDPNSVVRNAATGTDIKLNDIINDAPIKLDATTIKVALLEVQTILYKKAFGFDGTDGDSDVQGLEMCKDAHIYKKTTHRGTLRLCMIGPVSLAKTVCCYEVTRFLGIPLYVHGSQVNSCTVDCPVGAWLLPAQEKATMQVITNTFDMNIIGQACTINMKVLTLLPEFVEQEAVVLAWT